MPFDVTATIATVTARFQAEGTAARAASEQRYLKSRLRFFGMTVPGIRQTVRDVARQHPDLTRSDLLALAEACAPSEWHELRSFGIGMLERFVGRLETSDLPMVARHLAGYDTWAHVDWLACKVAGAIVARDPAGQAEVRRWAVSPVMWVRRSALLAAGLGRGPAAPGFSLFAELATPMLSEREFFIAKAIGWVLREVSKKQPEQTAAFLALAPDCSGVTWREAVKYLPAELRTPLDAARALRRPGRSRPDSVR